MCGIKLSKVVCFTLFMTVSITNIHMFHGLFKIYMTVSIANNPILQAVNRVGLTAVATSRAVIVDASAPLAGQVYDTINGVDSEDADYTVSSHCN